MTILRTDIERALDELISNQEGMRFQALAVTRMIALRSSALRGWSKNSFVNKGGGIFTPFVARVT